MHIILPPLRERPEDIEPLCERLSINLCRSDMEFIQKEFAKEAH